MLEGAKARLRTVAWVERGVVSQLAVIERGGEGDGDGDGDGWFRNN